jgi:hypothetical protein
MNRDYILSLLAQYKKIIMISMELKVSVYLVQ